MESIVTSFSLDIIFCTLSLSIPILEKRPRSCIGGWVFFYATLPIKNTTVSAEGSAPRFLKVHLSNLFNRSINHPMKLRRIVQIGVINQNPAANFAQLALSLLTKIAIKTSTRRDSNRTSILALLSIAASRPTTESLPRNTR